jgi:hypothetical protein
VPLAFFKKTRVLKLKWEILPGNDISNYGSIMNKGDSRKYLKFYV